MLIRRVFRQGNSLAVVLPAAYVEALGIGPGDMLALDMTKDGFLRVRPAAVGSWKTAEKEGKE